MLRIDLTRADAEPLDFAERPVVLPAAGGEDVVSVAPLEFSGRIERLQGGYRLDGRVAGAARLRCSRCLGEFDFQFADDVELRLLPAAALPQDDETRLGREDLDVRFYAEPVMDLAEVAGEQFGLAVPMKPLCAASCRGICPRCGANLNLGSCSCPATNLDDRLAPLIGWRPSE